MSGEGQAARLNTATNDRDIRDALRSFVRREYSDTSDLLLLEEFALYGGETRADLAVLNGVSHGYEIKSSRDTLHRLSRQVDAYNAVFERATLVSAERHIAKARLVIPTWWGIVKAESPGNGVSLIRLRQPRLNPAPERQAIAALLWRPEALRLLSQLGLDGEMRSKPMSVLIERLAESISTERLSELVRQALRARGDWQVAARRKRYDGTSLRRASWWRSRYAPCASRLR